MLLVPWWVLICSAIAPVLLIGGWATAAALQPASFDPFVQTISALGAYGATDRWLMTSVFFVVGLCYIAVAYGLAAVRAGARVCLLLGGSASVLVALCPEPAGGTSLQHLVSAGVGFAALAVWPCLAIVPGPSAPWALRPAVAITFTAVVAASAAWFLLELHAHSDAGLAERVVTGFQATWPLVVAVCLRGAPQRAGLEQRGVETQTADHRPPATDAADG